MLLPFVAFVFLVTSVSESALIEITRRGVYRNTPIVYKGFLQKTFQILSNTIRQAKENSGGGDVAARIYGNGRAHVFLNIPYAVPPLGKLAFELPKPMSAELYKMTVEKRIFEKFGNYCPQDETSRKPFFEAAGREMSLDCLTLNVFTPSRRARNLLSVYVLIHGGSLMHGSAADYGIRGIVKGYVSAGIVVVTLNYRLGTYGFFNFSDGGKGHSLRGLYDQVLALQWVRDNIAGFQGDPNRVTLGGFSAGACSVSVLALAALNPKAAELQGLFQQVILQSGDLHTCSEGSFVPRHSTESMVKQLCENESNLDKCIKSKSMDTILNAQRFNFPDGIFESIEAMKLNANADVKSPLRFFIGIDRDEFASFEPALLMPIFGKTTGVQYGSSYVAKIIAFLTQQRSQLKFLEAVMAKQFREYFSGDSTSEALYLSSMQMLSDLSFGGLAVSDTKFFAGLDRSVRLYKFDWRGALYANDSDLPFKRVAPHGTAFFYAFQPEDKWLSINWNDEEQLWEELVVARNIQKVFANFVYGKKMLNGLADLEDVPFDSSRLPYLRFSSKAKAHADGFISKSMQGLTEVFLKAPLKPPQRRSESANNDIER